MPLTGVARSSGWTVSVHFATATSFSALPFFNGPKSDHRLTDSLTSCCSVDFTDLTLADEDGYTPYLLRLKFGQDFEAEIRSTF